MKKIQNAKRSMKRKLKLIPNIKKEIKKLDKLGEGWKKSLENIKESTRERRMTWDYYDEQEEYILKEKKSPEKTILNSLDANKTKKLKKTLQAAEPTEFFGQDFTKMGELIDVLKELDFMIGQKTQQAHEKHG